MRAPSRHTVTVAQGAPYTGLWVVKPIGPAAGVQWLEEVVVEEGARHILHTRRNHPHLPSRHHRTNMTWPLSIFSSSPD